MTKILHVTGCKNAGKTRTVEVLLPLLADRHVSVGTLKYAERDHFDWERPGTDTDRHRLAGSRQVGILGEHSHAFGAGRSLRDIPLADILRMYYSPLDLVLIEGFQDAEGPRIEVQRTGYTDRRIGEDEGCLATYGDRILARGVPHFAFGAEPDLVSHIMSALELP